MAGAKWTTIFLKSKQEDVERGKLRQAQDPPVTTSAVVHRRVCSTRCCCARSGVPMSKHESCSPPTAASETSTRVRAGRSNLTVIRSSALTEIGFVGLGRMGAAMAANLAAEGRQIIAYVRRRDQIDALAAPGLRPTANIGGLLHCDVVISMLPDDSAVHEIVLGRGKFDCDGLAAGLRPGAIHLSM